MEESSTRADDDRGAVASVGRGAGDAPGRAPQGPAAAAIEAIGVGRRFKDVTALHDVTFSVRRGEIHALLGSNGAGKTTLIRVLTGLQDPTSGTVTLPGIGRPPSSMAARRRIGVVPSGDRTFYNRLSGFENLLFFARLHGLRKARAVPRAHEMLEAVGLTEAARRPVGEYSHGMQKRLSVARGLLMDPEILFVDEATHDLDPAGADKVRNLVADAAGRGAAVLWTTQRVDEIRGFANRVTVLHRGEVRFAGSVPQLMENSDSTRYLVRLHGSDGRPPTAAAVRDAAGATASIDDGGPDDLEHFLVDVRRGYVLGDALQALLAAGLRVSGCTEERSEVEEALLRLTDVRRADG